MEDRTTTSASITETASRSVIWTAMTEVVSRTASPIIMLVLARLLSPSDFGVVAIAMVVITFSQMFWDAGLNKALVQTNAVLTKVANVVFWTNLCLAVALYAVLFIVAPLAARFFNSPPSASILRVLGLQMIVAAASSVQQGLCVRKLDFRRLFHIRLLTAFFPGLLSIPAAVAGMGAWALVIGSLGGQILNMTLLWRQSSWRPQLRFSVPHAKRLFGFGAWVMAEAFGAWLILWGDSLLVGRFLGVYDLGVYRTGSMLVSLIFGLMLNPLLTVVYPMLSRLQSDADKLRRSFGSVNRLIIAVALPAGIGLMLLGTDVAALLFGAKWQNLGFVLAIVGLANGLAWTVGLNAEAYRAMGRPDINTKFMYGQMLVYVPAYAIGAYLGLKAMVVAKLVACLLSLPLHVIVLYYVMGITPLDLWRQSRSVLVAAAAMGASVWSVQSMRPELPAGILLAVLVAIGALVYAAVLGGLDRTLVVETRAMIARVLRSPQGVKTDQTPALLSQ